MRGLDHEISGHLHNVGAPIKLLHLVFEKIAAGKSVAIGFHIAPARIARDWRVAPAEFPSGMLGAQPPAFEPHGEGIRIERVERRHAVHHDQPMNIELELHQQFVAKAVYEIGGIRGAAHMADLHPRPRGVAELHHSWFRLKARQLVFDRLQRLDHLPSKEKFGPLLRLGNRQHLGATLSGCRRDFMQREPP